VNNFSEKVSFIWSVADLLRGPYRPNQYKDVMLPMTVLRRLDCVLEPTKDAVIGEYEARKGGRVKNLEPILNRVAGQAFHNTSPYTFERLNGDPDNIAANLVQYIKSFSGRARDIIEHFGFEEQIGKLDQANRLFLVVSRFCDIDLHPGVVPNIEMGYIFEELIRRFNEASNEEAGDHFTPREVIRLMVDLLFAPDGDVLGKKGIVRTLYDPACGTGGMLAVSEEYLRERNPDARLEVFGQDYNDQAYAICGSDMMIKGQSMENVRFGDSFTEDHFAGQTFDYMLANPPFGVEWRPQEDVIRKEHQTQGYGGRFGAGLPRINDGSFLFLQHMLSKAKPVARTGPAVPAGLPSGAEGGPYEGGGTRLAIVFNASPLFTGSAGSGESNIRKWIIENDWLEAIVALPNDMFYNTGISTYFWVLTNRKSRQRRGKVQLIDATSFFSKMRKSLGNKRNEIGDQDRETITRLYRAFEEGDCVRIFDNADFGYHRITVERALRLNFAVTGERLARVEEARQFLKLATSRKRKDTAAARQEIAEGARQQQAILEALRPLASHGIVKSRTAFSALMTEALVKAEVALRKPTFTAVLVALSERDQTAEVCLERKGNREPDPELRDHENVPLKEDIEAYMAREVLPHVPEAWVDESKTKVGYQINFSRYFYTYTPPRPLEEIEADLRQIEAEIAELLGEMG